MIKFYMRGSKGDLYGFGLSEGNIDLLKKGQPLVINMMEVGVPNMTVVLVYGETEETITKELQGHGIVPACFEPSAPEPGETRVFRDLRRDKSS